MSKPKDAAIAPAGPGTPAPDEYAGQGGAYEIDAATGRRRLVSRTASAPPAVPDHTRPAAAAEQPKE